MSLSPTSEKRKSLTLDQLLSMGYTLSDLKSPKDRTRAIQDASSSPPPPPISSTDSSASRKRPSSRLLEEEGHNKMMPLPDLSLRKQPSRHVSFTASSSKSAVVGTGSSSTFMMIPPTSSLIDAMTFSAASTTISCPPLKRSRSDVYGSNHAGSSMRSYSTHQSHNATFPPPAWSMQQAQDTIQDVLRIMNDDSLDQFYSMDSFRW